MSVKNHDTSKDNNAEVRLTRVETEVESLAFSLDKLVTTVDKQSLEIKQQSSETNRQLQHLIGAVTAASGPKNTDWKMLISLGLFILAIGGVAFSPMFIQIADNKTELTRLTDRAIEHQKLNLHPVGESRVDALEAMMVRLAKDNREAIVALDAKLVHEVMLADTGLRDRIDAHRLAQDEAARHMQTELTLIAKSHEDADRALQEQLDRRLGRIDEVQDDAIRRDLQELQQRRLRDDRRSTP